jgi:hypothetical protein
MTKLLVEKGEKPESSIPQYSDRFNQLVDIIKKGYPSLTDKYIRDTMMIKILENKNILEITDEDIIRLAKSYLYS